MYSLFLLSQQQLLQSFFNWKIANISVFDSSHWNQDSWMDWNRTIISIPMQTF